MVAEFIRLRPDPDTHLDPQVQRAFLCEFPDIREEQLDQWTNCGLVLATADRGKINRVVIELNNTIFEEIAKEGECFDTEEVARTVILSLVWENWLPMTRVSVRIIGGRRIAHGVYF